jgi:hypothetical protein
MSKQPTDPVSSKTSEEAYDFVRKMQEVFPKTPRSKKELARLRKYLAKYKDAELRAVGRRVLSDLMQRPPRTIHAGDLPPAPIPGPKPHHAPPPSGGASARTKPRKGTKPTGRPAGTRTAARPRRARRRARRP